jgi:hypothetical protein
VTVIVYVTGSPATSGPWSTSLLTVRSACGVVGVVIDAVSGAVPPGCGVAVVTEAVFVSAAFTSAATMVSIKIVMAAPGGTSPSEQRSMGATEHVPAVAAALTAVRPAASGSVTTTFCAVDGPAFVTTTRYRAGIPGTSGFVIAVLAMPTSARGASEVTMPDTLLAGVPSKVADVAVASLLTATNIAGSVFATMVIVSCPPLGSVPSEHVTVAPMEHDPAVEVADDAVRPIASGSATLTP